MSREPRIIRPSRNFLWKNYFQFFLIFFVTSVPTIVALSLFITFLSSIDQARGPVLQDLFLLLMIIYFLLWIIGGILYTIGEYLYIRNMYFIVHGHEIVVKKGLINITEKHVPYRTVTNIDMRIGLFDRLFQIGTVEIQTAGGSVSSSSLEAGPEEKLEGIRVYKEVRDYILTQLRAYQASHLDTSEGLTKKSADVSAIIVELQNIINLLDTRLAKLEKKIDELLNRDN
ncbi:PH domain-containing protein [Candidatus Hodarchaeum mangrovi]